MSSEADRLRHDYERVNLRAFEHRAEIDRLREELLARRACLEGAAQTLAMVAETLRNAQQIDLARSALLAPVVERIGLVGEAVANTDSALEGPPYG